MRARLYAIAARAALCSARARPDGIRKARQLGASRRPSSIASQEGPNMNRMTVTSCVLALVSARCSAEIALEPTSEAKEALAPSPDKMFCWGGNYTMTASMQEPDGTYTTGSGTVTYATVPDTASFAQPLFYDTNPICNLSGNPGINVTGKDQYVNVPPNCGSRQAFVGIRFHCDANCSGTYNPTDWRDVGFGGNVVTSSFSTMASFPCGPSMTCYRCLYHFTLADPQVFGNRTDNQGRRWNCEQDFGTDHFVHSDSPNPSVCDRWYL